MNTLIDIARSLKAAIFGVWTNGKTTAPAPVRLKLAGRRGYGDDDIPPPKL